MAEITLAASKQLHQPISGVANFRFFFFWDRSGLHWSGSALVDHNKTKIPI